MQLIVMFLSFLYYESNNSKRAAIAKFTTVCPCVMPDDRIIENWTTINWSVCIYFNLVAIVWECNRGVFWVCCFQQIHCDCMISTTISLWERNTPHFLSNISMNLNIHHLLKHKNKFFRVIQVNSNLSQITLFNFLRTLTHYSRGRF